MCIIVDANVAGAFFAMSPNDDVRVVIDWIDYRGGKIVLGGRLTEELYSIRTARRWLSERQRSGRAKLFRKMLVETEEQVVSASGLCKSDDPHVIALARVSGARVLMTRDMELQKDFKCRLLVNNPRGAIYTSRSHRHLLRHTRSCGER